MSFKVKSWNLYRTVDLSSEMKAYQTPGPAGINTRGFALPWKGKILVMGYGGDDTPVWGFYNPRTNSLEGPSPGGTLPWSQYWPNWGWAPDHYICWGNRWVVPTPSAIGYYYGSKIFYCWDENGAFHSPTFEVGDPDGVYPAACLGTNGSDPTVMSFQYGGGQQWICSTSPNGTVPLAQGPNYGDEKIYFHNVSGSPRIDAMRQLGPYYEWIHDGERVLYDRIPRDVDAGGGFVQGHFPLSSGQMDVLSGFVANPSGVGGVMEVLIGETSYWANMHTPLEPGTRPWQSTWHYRQMQFGGFAIDEYDLDGIDHGCAPAGPLHFPVTKSGDWFFGLDDLDYTGGGIHFSVYVLQASQPVGRARRSGALHNGSLGWMGDYQLGADLSLRHVLPLPEGRSPSGSGSMPPQERNDGFTLGDREVYRQAGGGYKYVRDIQVDLSSYSHSSNWWFPGEDPERFYPGLWHLFAGVGPTVIGYMPDPSWGTLTPEGQPCDRLLGVPEENLNATMTHVCRNSHVVSEATFAQRLSPSAISERYLMLHSGFDGRTFTYVDACKRLGSMPAWKAVVGTVTGRTWQTVKEFDKDDRPHLGETNWTVWSVVPIPVCRALPRGGWLVGATLYFDPWDESSWEWTVGGRTAKFQGTSNGWVPAKPGWRGPLNDDDHHPIYLSGYDEWTFGRSQYGPDALLVYDHEGNLVTHLNSLGVHAPDGREVIVTGEARPKVVFRIYRHGTYSDFAEGYGQYHRLSSNQEIQAPLYVCYDLMDAAGRIAPGLGTFHGFVDMYEVGEHAPKDSAWRWSVPPTIYDWEYPQSFWLPPASAYVRSGRGSGGLTLLGGHGSGRGGVRGPGGRA